MRRTVAHRIICFILICFSLQSYGEEILSRNEEYILRYSQLAQEHQVRYKIPAEITLAQGILESAAGSSRLAREANNHFGIEAHYWNGDTVQYGGRTFRKYQSVEESFQDHSQFLLAKRYSSLFDLDITDYKGWARGLKSCGYAEDANYDQKLINIIERHELSQYTTTADYVVHDVHTQEQVSSHRPIYKAWGLLYVEAREGDSYETIANDLGFRGKDLAQYNDAKFDDALQEGDIVYLEKKHRKATEGYDTHIVRKGETIHSISQIYGIDCRRLARRNKMRYDTPISAGMELILR